MTRAQQLQRLLDEQRKRRGLEKNCAWRFKVQGEPHEDCVFDEPCSRYYDPTPRMPGSKLSAEGVLDEPKDYQRSGIGLLYGDGNKALAYELAGWTVRRQGDLGNVSAAARNDEDTTTEGD